MVVYVDKNSGRIELYGSLKVLYQFEKVKIGIRHFYNSVTGDYEDELCRIVKREAKRAKQDKLPEVKKFPLPDMLPEPKELPLPDSLPLPTKQTNLKINILEGTYIKKDQYYFNLDGHILDEKQFLSIYGKKYNLPKNTFGEIKNLL